MFFVFAKQSVFLRIQVVLAGAVGWSETEMGERDWGETLKGRVRLARFARALLHPHKRFARVICTHSV